MLTEEQKDTLLKYIDVEIDEAKGISGKNKTKLKESLLPRVNEYLVELVRANKARREYVQELLNTYLPDKERNEKLPWLELIEEEIIYILSQSIYSVELADPVTTMLDDETKTILDELTTSVNEIKKQLTPPSSPVQGKISIPDLDKAHPRPR